MKLPFLASTALLVATAGAQSTAASPTSRPNIVLILADDMGYGDAHAPSAVCTPTRYGALTGRYCWRSRLRRGR